MHNTQHTPHQQREEIVTQISLLRFIVYQFTCKKDLCPICGECTCTCTCTMHVAYDMITLLRYWLCVFVKMACLPRESLTQTTASEKRKKTRDCQLARNHINRWRGWYTAKCFKSIHSTRTVHGIEFNSIYSQCSCEYKIAFKKQKDDCFRTWKICFGFRGIENWKTNQMELSSFFLWNLKVV